MVINSLGVKNKDYVVVIMNVYVCIYIYIDELEEN